MVDMLAQVGSEGAARRQVEKISGGEIATCASRPRVAFPTRSCCCSTKPAAASTSRIRKKFYDLIARSTRSGASDPARLARDERCEQIRDHVLCLKDGHIHCQGSPRDIRRRDMLKQIFGAEIRVYGHAH